MGINYKPSTATGNVDYKKYLDDPLKAPQGTATTEIAVKKGATVASTQQTEEKLTTPPIEPWNLCHVHVSGSQTLNLGNYESVKITVGVTLPCAKSDLSEAYEWSTNWVSNKITSAVADAKGE
jgi:hypothetical protein